MNVLFVSHTGALEPLGQSQVVPYVIGLSRRGHRMRLLSFEREAQDSAASRSLKKPLPAATSAWRSLKYHRRPAVASTLYDVAAAVRLALSAVREGVKLLHARSHVPGLVADLVFSLTGVPYLFDHRGLMAEEYADAGIWRRDRLLYRLTTRFEQRFLSRARGVVVLTHRLAREIESSQRLKVIPWESTCSAFSRAMETPHPTSSWLRWIMGGRV